MDEAAEVAAILLCHSRLLLKDELVLTTANLHFRRLAKRELKRLMGLQLHIVDMSAVRTVQVDEEKLACRLHFDL